jgi:hypothetical protein
MSGSNEHPKTLRLFDLARNRGPQLTDKEGEHLRDCQECQWILEVFMRQFSKPPKDKPKEAA